MLKTTLFGSIAALSALISSAPGRTIVDPEPTSPWDVSFDTGLNLSRGNTDSLSVRSAFDAKRITSLDEIYLGAGLSYGELEDSVTNEDAYAFGQYNLLLSDRFYFGVRSDFLYDDIADLDYRVSIAPLLGYYLIDTDRTKLAVEAGVGYQWEDQGGSADEYAIAQLNQRFEHEICSGVNFWQTFSFKPELEDFDNYSFVARAGIETTLSDSWSLLTYAEDRYDSNVPHGIEKNDVGVFAALSYSVTGNNEPVMVSGGKSGKVTIAASGSPWNVSLASGLAFTDGNSDTLLATADLSAHADFGDSEVFLGAGGAYGETDNAVNAQRAYAFAQYNKFISGPVYAGARTDFLYDEISLVDYRVAPAAVLGVYLVKEENTSLSIEVGPSYTFEKIAGAGERNYFSVYAGQRFNHQLSDRLSVFQSLTVSLDTEDTDNYVLDARAGVDVKLTEKISWQTGIQNIYDNQPAPGAEDNDFLLTTGFAIHF